MPLAVRVYDPVCIKNGHLDAENLNGRLVKHGLLILEEKSGCGGIPNNLWIFYKSDESKLVF